MKLLLIILATVLVLLHPWLALAAVLAACAGLGLLVTRAANARVYPCPWRTT